MWGWYDLEEEKKLNSECQIQIGVRKSEKPRNGKCMFQASDLIGWDVFKIRLFQSRRRISPTAWWAPLPWPPRNINVNLLSFGYSSSTIYSQAGFSTPDQVSFLNGDLVSDPLFEMFPRSLCHFDWDFFMYSQTLESQTCRCHYSWLIKSTVCGMDSFNS